MCHCDSDALPQRVTQRAEVNYESIKHNSQRFYE